MPPRYLSEKGVLGLGQKLFKSGLFGFKKKSVNQYINDLAQNYANEISQKDEQIAQLTKENGNLKGRLDELEGRTRSMESERDYIANAIIQAEQEAQRMMENAKKSVEERRKELEAEMTEDMRRSEEIKQHLASLRQDAIAVMREYEEKLGQLTEQE